MKVGDTVRLARPQYDVEAAARFTVVELNGDRALIRLQCSLPIPPIELVATEDIAPPDDAQ